MDIILDGLLINNKKELFVSLKKQINSDEFYGDNLDALWDVLTYLNEPLKIKIVNFRALQNNLGDYADNLKKLFIDLVDYNKLNSLEIIE